MTWEKEFEKILNCFNIEDDKKSDALGVYYISKYFNINDFNYLWNEKKISRGGGNDRKVDLLYLNEEDKYVVIAQSFMTAKTKESAPTNKATDLNTAISTIFGIDSNNIDFSYSDLKDEIQEKILNIQKIYIFYIHNLPESENANKEVQYAGNLAKKLVEIKNPEIEIICKEVGQNAFKNEFDRKNENIIIKDKIEFSIESNKYFEIKNEIFSIINTKIYGKELNQICNRYKDKFDDIFSANLRNYLGSSKRNKINQNILKTINTEPEKFYIFNNGITILTNKYTINQDNNKIILDGFSIINGAQTTGSICDVEYSEISDKLMIQTRIIEKPIENQKGFLEDIITYNNTQNQIESADLRSNDLIQKRLIEDFKSNGYNYKYSGGKRGGAIDSLLNDYLYISHYKVGQLLWAFHTNEVKEAYNNRKLFFENDEYYNKIFTKELGSRHIIFLHTIFNSITTYKDNLDKNSSLTHIDEEINSYLHKKGIEYLILHIFFDFLEKIFKTSITNKYNIKIKENIKLDDYIIEVNKDVEHLIKLLRTKLSIAFLNNNSSKNEPVNRLGDKENINKCIEELQTKISCFEEEDVQKFAKIKNFLEIN